VLGAGLEPIRSGSDNKAERVQSNAIMVLTVKFSNSIKNPTALLKFLKSDAQYSLLRFSLNKHNTYTINTDPCASKLRLTSDERSSLSTCSARCATLHNRGVGNGISKRLVNEQTCKLEMNVQMMRMFHGESGWFGLAPWLGAHCEKFG